MSVYPPPSSYPAIFNPAVFVSDSSGSGISSAEADATYAKLAGGQTIVAQETFSGGIKTNTIVPATGTDVTITGNSSQTGNLTISGNITQNSGYSTSLRTTTINGTATVTRLIQSGSTSENSFAGNCTFSQNVFLGSSTILASSWTASTLSGSTYSYTISLSSITSGDFAGQIYISVKNTTTASLLSQLNYFAVKANGVLTLTSTSSPPNNFGTYTLNSVTTNKLTVASSNTAITVSTYTTSSSVCWYFVGAIV